MSSGVTARHQGADNEGRRTRMTLLMADPFGHRPHDRQLAPGADAGNLLGVERQVVAQHASDLAAATLVSNATSSSPVAMSSSKAKRLDAMVAVEAFSPR